MQNSSSGDWLSCADSAMRVVTASLTEAPFGAAIDALNRYRDELNSVEALLIAQRKHAGHSDRSTEGIITSSGGVSKGEAKKRTKRADAVSKNPKLAKSLTTGGLSTEQVDLVADASDKTGGDAATDEKLIADIGAANPDQGKAIARKYVDDHQSQGDRDSRYAWQRERRKVLRGRSKNGLSQLIIEGDDESIAGMLRALRRQADALYRSDGGRDVSGSKHARTNDQRMFDAAVNQITGTAATTKTDTPASSTDAREPSPDTAPAGSAPAPAPAPTKATPPRNRPGERPTMVFTGKLSDISNDPAEIERWTAELIGEGTVPSAVVSYYRCISDHSAVLLSESGAVLWKGRAVRTATTEQWIALVVRDGGCVLCQADHTQCEAHHLIPWEAPRQGETDIDNLAMVCVDCHHRIHDNHQTLFWDVVQRRWRLRVAKPDEIPPNGRRGSPGRSIDRPGQQRSATPRPEHSRHPAKAAPESPPAQTDPHARETANGVLRHDLFDWIE